MTDGSVTNPAARRTYSRRKMLAKWLRDPRWKQMLADHAHTPGAECVYCHRKHKQVWNGKTVTLTINHASRHLYLSEELYLTWDSQFMEITCLMCNRKYEKGMKPCPSCLKKGKMVYILDRDSECNPCYLEKNQGEAKKAREGCESFKKSIKDYNAGQATRRRKAKVRHPCSYHGINQKCRSNDMACPYSPSKAAKNCFVFHAKKGVVKK